MVSPGARRYMVNVCSASFSLSSCKPQKTQVLLWYGLLQIVYAIALSSGNSLWRDCVGAGRSPSPRERGPHATEPQRIRHHAHRTERHGNSCEHGIEQDA